MDILIAGLGNVLRGDDGFGVAVVDRLSRAPVPDGVRVVELGIGGIHLVQDLLRRVHALVIIDAVDLGRPPGTVLVLRPDIRDVTTMTPRERHDELADMHYTTPDRALMLANALRVLPAHVWLVGCQPAEPDLLGMGLSPVVESAIEPAVREIRRLVRTLGVDWH